MSVACWARLAARALVFSALATAAPAVFAQDTKVNFQLD